MDREQQEIQFLGFFGIFKRAFNIITSHRKIFGQITLSVILPLSFIYSAQNEFSEFFFGKLTPADKTSDIFSSFWLFKIAFFLFSIILSLLSTSAVVYTTACIHSDNEIIYKKVMKVVPKVWKRLMITFLWNFIIVFAIIIAASLIVIIFLFLWVFTLGQSATGMITIAIILILVCPLVYMSFVWQLANVISVLEDEYGLQAMLKSKYLIKGNTGLCAAILFTYNICFLGIDQGFKASVVGVDSVWGKILHSCLWAMIMSMFSLFTLVVQTIIYFICKSYHHESIDKSSLANHLEVNPTAYVQLDTKDVHIQQSMV